MPVRAQESHNILLLPPQNWGPGGDLTFARSRTGLPQRV